MNDLKMDWEHTGIQTVSNAPKRTLRAWTRSNLTGLFDHQHLEVSDYTDTKCISLTDQKKDPLQNNGIQLSKIPGGSYPYLFTGGCYYLFSN